MQNIYTFDGPNSVDLSKELAERVRARRLEKGLSREALSVISGVPTPTIARFEQKYLISLRQFLDIAISLGFGAQLEPLLSEAQFSTMQELEQIRKNKNRKHGRSTTNK